MSLKVIIKHLPGKHSQALHGKGGSSGGGLVTMGAKYQKHPWGRPGMPTIVQVAAWDKSAGYRQKPAKYNLVSMMGVVASSPDKNALVEFAKSQEFDVVDKT